MVVDYFSLFILFLFAIPLVFIRPAGRRLLGAMGLAVGLVTQFLVGGGPDNFGTIFPFLGFSLAIAALLAEAMAFLAGGLRGHAGHGPEQGD